MMFPKPPSLLHHNDLDPYESKISQTIVYENQLLSFDLMPVRVPFSQSHSDANYKLFSIEIV